MLLVQIVMFIQRSIELKFYLEVNQLNTYRLKISYKKNN